MKKVGFFLIGMTILFSGVAIASKKAEQSENIIPVRALFESPSLYDGKEVTVKGEVIGDIMRDGERFWINIEDEGFFIGVVTNRIQKEKIKYSGRYRIKGDIVKVSGIYHLHCLAHSGERDIHCEQFEIIGSGYEEPEIIDNNRIFMSILLGVITILTLILSHRKNIRKDTDGQQM